MNIQNIMNVMSQPLPLVRPTTQKEYKIGDVFNKPTTPTLNDYIHLYTLSFLMALDSCELPLEKTHEIMEKVYENAECMISGHINQKDVEKMARETYGIEFIEGLRTRFYVVGDKIIKV